MKRVNSEDEDDDNVSSISAKRLKLSNNNRPEVDITMKEDVVQAQMVLTQTQESEAQEDFPELSEKGLYSNTIIE